MGGPIIAISEAYALEHEVNIVDAIVKPFRGNCIGKKFHKNKNSPYCTSATYVIVYQSQTMLCKLARAVLALASQEHKRCDDLNIYPSLRCSPFWGRHWGRV